MIPFRKMATQPLFNAKLSNVSAYGTDIALVEIPIQELHESKVDLTIVDGKTVFERN